MSALPLFNVITDGIMSYSVSTVIKNSKSNYYCVKVT